MPTLCSSYELTQHPEMADFRRYICHFFRPLLGFITFACYAELINAKD